MELLPVEISELLFSYVRPADLVSLAASSPQLEDILHSARLWRQATAHVTSDNFGLSLRQLELAPELQELTFGSAKLDSEAVKAISNYQGPIPFVRTLRLNLSALGTELGGFLLARHGLKARYLELDLRHGLLEKPRDHLAVIQRLPYFGITEGLIVRADHIRDMNMLIWAPQPIVELDIHRLRLVGQDLLAGFTAALSKSRHIRHLQVLRLPLTFDASLSALVLNCRELRTLACNVWTFPAVKYLNYLQSLLIFPPDISISENDIRTLMLLADDCSKVFAGLKELRFVNGDVDCNLYPMAKPYFAQAVMSLLLAKCKNLEVLEVQWNVEKDAGSGWSWLDPILSNDSVHLRELWLQGFWLSPQRFGSLKKHCPQLEILDLRRSINPKFDDGSSVSSLTTEGQEGMRRAVALLLQAVPKLTVLFDDDADNYYDWNTYLDSFDENSECTGNEKFTCVLPIEYIPKDMLQRLSVHLHTLDEWSVGKDFVIPSQVQDVEKFWRCATLDSSFWSTENFTEILRTAPALGLLDCRNEKALLRGNKGYEWMNALTKGPNAIVALRIRAVLVPSKLWKNMAPILRRIKKSLRFLELDFRGRPFRDWRDTLVSLEDVPNLTELVLRGSFNDDKPVLDWLHGRLRSLQRLDLRDCLMSQKQMPAFLESLRTLLLELKETLRAVALPPLPLHSASLVLRTLGELVDLREVSLHTNELESLRPLTELCSLELYENRRQRNAIHLDRLTCSFRNLSDTLRGVESLTLPVSLVKSQLVRESIFDVMPNLRKLHLIDRDRKIRLCAEGPLCKRLISKLV